MYPYFFFGIGVLNFQFSLVPPQHLHTNNKSCKTKVAMSNAKARPTPPTKQAWLPTA
jgi:hypothetical protein